MATDYDAVFGEIVYGDNGDVSAVQAAIDAGHDINCIDNSDNWTLLHYVLVPIMWRPNVDIVGLLVKNGAKINQPDRRQWTPLHCAARTGCHDTLRVLLTSGADPNLPDDEGVTPFHRYFLQGRIDPKIVQLFIDHGAKPSEMHLSFATACEYSEKADVLPRLKHAAQQ